MSVNSFSSSLLKAFDILDCFSEETPELGIKELAATVDMPQSSVYRMVQSLVFSGLLYQNGSTKKYRLGPKMTVYSGRSRSLNTYRDIAIKYMQKIAEETDETVDLGILDRDRIVYSHRITCKHVLKPDFVLEAYYPAVKTGLGMSLIADLAEPAVRWIYENNACDIGKTYEEFLDEIKEIRKNGCAFDDQVFCEGLRCVAAPVKGPGGKALFSISVSAPTLRMDDETYDRARKTVMKYTSQASREIQEL
ncbi:MAG: IclR family transcriptional regulator [Firmicutes bacterium]|nr:IclR family transcriptional regulator [Bacillota bacterium]